MRLPRYCWSFVLQFSVLALLGAMLVPGAGAATNGTVSVEYLNCASAASDTFETTSSSFVDVRRCTLFMPSAATVTIIATASMAITNNVAASEFEANFRLGVDNSLGLDSSDRWVNVRSDAGDGTDKSMAISQTVAVTPGYHTFSLLVRRSGGAGIVRVFNASLSAVTAQSFGTCGSVANSTFVTAAGTFNVAAQCSLTVPSNSRLLIMGSGSYGMSGNTLASEYEANTRIGVNDATIGSADTDRWNNVYVDTGDGTDESMGVSFLSPVVAPGQHTVNLLIKRQAGTGTVTLFDPALSVIAVPEFLGSSCGGSASQTYTNATGNFTNAQSCNITSSVTGAALVLANGSVSMFSNTVAQATEFQGRITVNGSPVLASNRWTNVYNDNAVDGNDRLNATSVIVPISPGVQSFSYQGARYAGTGTAQMLDPTIAAIVLAPTSDLWFVSTFE